MSVLSRAVALAAVGGCIAIAGDASALAQGAARGVVIGDAGEPVHVRQRPSLKGETVFAASTGEIVAILREGSERASLDGSDDHCAEYPWVQVRDRANRTGWVFGEFVYRVLPDPELISDSVPVRFRIEGTEYRLALTRNYGVGAWDPEEGLLGCDEFYPVVIHTPDWETAEFLEQRNVPFYHQRGWPGCCGWSYWSLRRDDGIGDEIVGLQQHRPNEVDVVIHCTMQEGDCRYRVRIHRERARWLAVAHDVQVNWE